jgi:nitrate reductase gamma subunit
MGELTGIILIIIAYVCTTVFIWRILWRILLLFRTVILKILADVFFLTRLFRTNKPLWIGELIFHWAFLLVLMRHIRYVVFPVPQWVIGLQPAGIYAGYILSLSLIYILMMKFFIEKKTYFSSYNFYLLFLLLLISLTGIVMKYFMRPDIVDIKHFMLSTIMLKTANAPNSMLFVVHFIATFIFLASLPTHIFTAPFTILDARKRENGLNIIIHET